jgi:hypothetical protein
MTHVIARATDVMGNVSAVIVEMNTIASVTIRHSFNVSQLDVVFHQI